MKSDWAIIDEIKLDEYQPFWLRVMLLSIGCVFIISPLVDNFWAPSLLPQNAPPILIFLIGALVSLIAIFGRDKVWKIREGEIYVDQKRLFGRWKATLITPADIREIFVSDRSDETGISYVVEICPTDSPFYIQSPGFKEKIRAEELLQEIVRRLRLSKDAVRNPL